MSDFKIVVRGPSAPAGERPRAGDSMAAPADNNLWRKRVLALSALMFVGIVAVVGVVMSNSSGDSSNSSAGQLSKRGAGGVGASTGAPSPTAKPSPNWPTMPTPTPTGAPTHWPTWAPTKAPTDEGDTASPSQEPTRNSFRPTANPTVSPSAKPTTAKPTTAKPTTAKPTTAKPTMSPSAKPTTAKPTTAKPTTANPTTAWPTMSPSVKPTTAKPTASPTFSPTEEPDVCVPPRILDLVPSPGCVSLTSLVRSGVKTVIETIHESIHHILDFCDHDEHELGHFERDAARTAAVLATEVLDQITGDSDIPEGIVNGLLEVFMGLGLKANICVGSFSGATILAGGGPDVDRTSKMLHFGGCSQIPLDPAGTYSVFSFSIPAVCTSPLCPAHLTQYGHTVAACFVIGDCGALKPVVAVAANKGVATCAVSSLPMAVAVGGLAGGLAAIPVGAASYYSCYPPMLMAAAPVIGVLPSLGVIAATPIGASAALGVSPSGKGLQSSVEIWSGLNKPINTVKTKANLALALQASLDTSYVVPIAPYVRLQVDGQALFSLKGDSIEKAHLLHNILHTNTEGDLMRNVFDLFTEDVMMSARGDVQLEMGLSSFIPWLPKIVVPLADADVLASLAPKSETGVPRGLYITAKNNKAAAQAIQSIIRPLLSCFGEIIQRICGVSADAIADHGDFNDVNHALFAVTSNSRATGFRIELPLLTSIFDGTPFNLLESGKQGTFILECECNYKTKTVNCDIDVDGSTLGTHFVSIVQEGTMMVAHLANSLFEIAQDGSDILCAVALEVIGEFHECTIGAIQEGNLDDCVIFEALNIQQTAQFVVNTAGHLLDHFQGWATGTGIDWCGISMVKDEVACGLHEIVDATICGVKNLPDALHCGVDFIEDKAHCGVREITDSARCGIDYITHPDCGFKTVTSIAECGIEHFQCGTQMVTSAAKCGTKLAADAAICGVKKVTSIPLCGAELVTDAAKCGVKTVTSVFDCGLKLVGCLFGNCAETCEIPKSCEAAKTCDVAETCKVPLTCPEPIMCDKPATCQKMKTCGKALSCLWPKKCNVPITCPVIQTCMDAKTCPVSTTCKKQHYRF